MNLFKALSIPSIIFLSLIIFITVMEGIIWLAAIIMVVQVNIALWITRQDEQELIKETQKLWKKIMSIF